MNGTRWLIACLLTALVGCSSEGGGGSANIGATPASTAEAFMTAATKNEPQQLWYLLPPSYQKDLNEIISTTASSLDEGLYDDSMKLAANIGQLFSTKGEWIVTNPTVGVVVGQAGAGPQELKAAAKSLGTIIGLICDSGIKTKAGLAKLDVGAYLAKNGSKLMAEFKGVMALMPKQPGQDSGVDILSNLDAMKIEVVSTTGDSAVLRTTTTGESPKDMKLVKVDGKWLPEVFAKDWAAQIAKLKSDIAGQAKMSPGDLANAKKMVGQIGQFVETLLNAKTQDDFNVSLNSIPGMIGTMMGGVLER